MGKGEGDDLPRIAGVGQDFLIAGHSGVEADLADPRAGRAIALSPDHRPVGTDTEAGGARGTRGGWGFRRDVDRKSAVKGKGVHVIVELGVRLAYKKNN